MHAANRGWGFIKSSLIRASRRSSFQTPSAIASNYLLLHCTVGIPVVWATFHNGWCAKNNNWIRARDGAEKQDKNWRCDFLSVLIVSQPGLNSGCDGLGEVCSWCYLYSGIYRADVFIYSKYPGCLLPILSCVYLVLYSQNVCVCGCLCMCVCVCACVRMCLE